MYLRISKFREVERWNNYFAIVKFSDHTDNRTMLFCHNSISKIEFLKQIVQFEELPEELVIILKHIVDLTSITYYEDDKEMCLSVKESFGKYFSVSFELKDYAIYKFLEALC